jgi:hypothetical protein
MNPTLADSLQLRDIHLPPAPGLWPPAPGWWLLAALLLALCIWLSILLVRRIRRQRRRQRLLALLADLERSPAEAPQQKLAQLSLLLRQLALGQFPRRQVAAITGNDWLHFLDATGGNGRFADGPGRVLAEGPYMRELPRETDIAAITGLVRDWIRTNSGDPHGA